MVQPQPTKLTCSHCGHDKDVTLRDGYPECRDRTKCWARWDKQNGYITPDFRTMWDAEVKWQKRRLNYYMRKLFQEKLG